MEIGWQNGRLASYLSRSLTVIGIDTDRSTTYDFTLVIHSYHGPILVFPLEYYNGGWALKLRSMPLIDDGKNLTICAII